MRTDDELSLAEKVAKFPQLKRDQIFASYTQADFASLSSIHDRPGYSRSVPLADVATHCNRLVRGQQYGLLCASIEWQHMIRAAALRARSDNGRGPPAAWCADPV